MRPFTLFGVGLLALCVYGFATPGVPAAEATVLRTIDDFEGELKDWTAATLDPTKGFTPGAAVPVRTTEAAEVRTGKGALRVKYAAGDGLLQVVSCPRPVPLQGMKSLRCAVHVSRTAVLIVGVNEKGGAAYQTSFVASPGTWTDVWVNVSDLLLGEGYQDTVPGLDPAAVEGFFVYDAVGLLAAEQPDLKGERTLVLDDISVSSEAAPVAQGVFQAPDGPCLRIDGFEASLVRWLPLSLDLSTGKPLFLDSALNIDGSAPASGGKYSLRWSYTRTVGKLGALLRDLGGLPTASATELRLWAKTARDGTFMIALEEKDDSRYQVLQELKAGDGWKELRLPFTQFGIADDSKDENGRLDAGELKNLSLADLTALLGADVGAANDLSIDEVLLSPA